MNTSSSSSEGRGSYKWCMAACLHFLARSRQIPCKGKKVHWTVSSFLACLSVTFKYVVNHWVIIQYDPWVDIVIHYYEDIHILLSQAVLLHNCKCTIRYTILCPSCQGVTGITTRSWLVSIQVLAIIQSLVLCVTPNEGNAE